jgi:hydrogenase maturation protease
MAANTKRILLIGYGNPARADDGLGPALAEIIESKNIPDITVETDYQLTIEDSAQVAEHDIVIFADASTNGPEPFSFEQIEAKESESFSSHSIEPAAVLALAENLFGSKAKGFILGIRGYEFDSFSEGLTNKAKTNLKKAACFVEELLKTKNFNKISETIACF